MACVSGQLVSCQISLPKEPTDRTHEHNLQAVLFIMAIAQFGGLVPQKFQQFAASVCPS
jgi:hypothetical protein